MIRALESNIDEDVLYRLCRCWPSLNLCYQTSMTCLEKLAGIQCGRLEIVVCCSNFLLFVFLGDRDRRRC